MRKKSSLSRGKAEERTIDMIVEMLKKDGPSDALNLAARLGVSSPAIRQHLYALRDRGLVDYQEEPRQMGRPAKVWHLTATAESLFPTGSFEFLLTLIRSAQDEFGPSGLEKILCRCVNQQIQQYQERMPQSGGLRERLKALVAARNEDGYMADIKVQDDGSFLLVENHCPISKAAEACGSLCDGEMEVFRCALGETVEVDRTEHILAGQRRCVYRIAPCQPEREQDPLKAPVSAA